MNPSPAQPDPGGDTLRRYVIGGTEHLHYRELIGGLFFRLPIEERAEFLRHLGRDARQITDAEIEFLLRDNWRARVVAGWMIGLDRRTQFRERVGKTLIAGDFRYACEAYCIALTMLGTAEDAALLAAYLDQSHLHMPEWLDERRWVLGTLHHLDDTLGSDYAAEFPEPDAPWGHWMVTRYGAPANAKAYISELCALADRHARGSDALPPE